MATRPKPAHPNVVLVITDDQGYGDLGCTGNPWVYTPNIDRFCSESVRLTDFHASPLCAPTRGALLTGRRPLRNGVWATCWGRSILRRDEVTLAAALKGAGYQTGMFGKWHLGDNYPYRPQDRGFDRVVAHKGGGVGQTPDFWGNNYFDDVYFRNGKPEQQDGYCTDVWFTEASRFIHDCTSSQPTVPFFCYIATNAPHHPYLVPERYAKRYLDNPEIPEPEFFGMIECIDENFGKLRQLLGDLGIEEDTILIFMTDNGSSGGAQTDHKGFVTRGYNAGMRGLKGSYYDGGHRVPFFIRWPNGSIEGGRDISGLSAHVDVMPTLLDLCGIVSPLGVRFDGRSLAHAMSGSLHNTAVQRTEFIQYRQDTVIPEKWHNAVLTNNWRLVYGTELFNYTVDAGQTSDVAKLYPAVVCELRKAHEVWWAEVSLQLDRLSYIDIGHTAENPTRLDAMDVLGDVAWNQVQVANACESAGVWAVRVTSSGLYRFSLSRWPSELGLRINSALDATRAALLAPYVPHAIAASSSQLEAAYISIAGKSIIKRIEPDADDVRLELELDAQGETTLSAHFIDRSGGRHGAYYVYIERL